jgi:hypothetical protein
MAPRCHYCYRLVVISVNLISMPKLTHFKTNLALLNYSSLMYWALMLFIWFFALSLRDLISTDEDRYADIAMELLQTGDCITPRLNGLLYFEKPPLQY